MARDSLWPWRKALPTKQQTAAVVSACLSIAGFATMDGALDTVYALRDWVVGNPVAVVAFLGAAACLAYAVWDRILAWFGVYLPKFVHRQIWEWLGTGGGWNVEERSHAITQPEVKWQIQARHNEGEPPLTLCWLESRAKPRRRIEILGPVAMGKDLRAWFASLSDASASALIADSQIEIMRLGLEIAAFSDSAEEGFTISDSIIWSQHVTHEEFHRRLFRVRSAVALVQQVWERRHAQGD